MKQEVARFLERIEIEVIIFHEQISGNQTIVEKLKSYSNVSFAVVLLSPDDCGQISGSNICRARQNVILELGYFIGRLGRDSDCALKKGDVEIPSDYDGVIYTEFDAAGAWKIALAREIDAKGIEVDFNLAVR